MVHTGSDVKNHHVSALRSRCILFIIDGMGDLPSPELSGLTPLEAASTPVLDLMAGNGLYGLVDPIRQGAIPNTHSGVGRLMGLIPEQANFLCRGPVEAAGRGVALAPGDIAMRTNFATLELRADGLWVKDRRAGRITRATDELAFVLQNIDLGDGIRGSLSSTDQHRGVLVLSGAGLSGTISNTDPGEKTMPAPLLDCRAIGPGAEVTAAKVNQFVAEAHRLLAEHPVNSDRISNGELPANGVITRGAGQQFNLDNVLHKLGIKAAVVSGCNTVNGVGKLLGLEVITKPAFTADINTDLDGKIAAAMAALAIHDMVFVHIKAPDICSHERQPLSKRDMLQRIDEAMAPLVGTDFVVAVGADHTTDSNTSYHTADPVPSLICKMKPEMGSSPVIFGEAACRSGNMARQSSHHFLLTVLRTMGHQVV